MKAKKNQAIRDALEEFGLAQWELADLMSITETSLCRKMRYELPEEEQHRIIDIIRKAGVNNA